MSDKLTAGVARRVRLIKPFHVMDLLGRAKVLEGLGRDIIHLEVGEPDFDTPAPIVAAGQRALVEGQTHYTPALGLMALREAIATFYKTRYGVVVAPEQVVVTPGASGALLLVLALLIDPDTQVMMTDPGYPCNRQLLTLLGAQAHAVPVDESTDYQLDARLVREHWSKTMRAVLLASPANPTGSVLALQQLAAISDTVCGLGGYMVVDEIYHGLTYSKPADTVLSVSDKAFVINSFSKYFGMTGWRLGWLVTPPAYVDPLERLAQNLFIAPPTLSQYAALAAFEPPTREILEARKAEFAQRRDFLKPALESLGMTVRSNAEGAFYLYADVSKFTDDSFALCYEALEKAGVAITPGIDFGGHQANTHVRFAYTVPIERLAEAVERLRRFLSEH